MPITEAARHQLLTALTRTIGEEAAMTLADHLPPVGWADVATKEDLDHLDVRFEATLHRELGALRSEMMQHQRNLFFAILAAFTANSGVVVATLALLQG